MMGQLGRSLGLGPVFVYEWLTASRRWQGYALRAGFVAFLLGALVVVAWGRAAPAVATRRALAELGQQFYVAVVGTQLTLVLLAAPAATAGAICLDRARGTLTHLLVTELTDSEIVLGKLGSRLVPVLGLVACALPVMSLLSLLGGVDPDALVGAFLVTAGVGLLGCALALVFSLWAGKTHEALMGTYTVWGLWLLGPWMVPHLSWTLGVALPPPPPAFDPLTLAFGPYSRPGSVGWADYLTFLGGTTAVSALLAGLAVWRLRPVCNRDRNRARGGPGRLSGLLSRVPGPPGPSVDFNPVLWREWHRNRPSRWARLIFAVYFGLAGFFSVTVIVSGSRNLAPFVNAFQVSVGLLMLSVNAATSMAEERVRGSLDVLMATPLTTRQIVVGKWLGAFRGAFVLAVLPTLVILLGGAVPLDLRLTAAAILAAFVLTQGAMLTSLGLAMATRVSRLGRAVGLTVTVYVAVTVGWMFLVMTVTSPGRGGEDLVCASAFFGAGGTTADAYMPGSGRYLFPTALWSGVYAAVAAALLWSTLLGFNRRMGRVERGLLWEWNREVDRGAVARAAALELAGPGSARP